MLPSKIFEYMSTGKKIIHVSKGEGDICIEHYKKYPNVLIINEMDEVDVSAKAIKLFMQKECETVDLEQLKEVFKENTPEYTIDLMVD